MIRTKSSPYGTLFEFAVPNSSQETDTCVATVLIDHERMLVAVIDNTSGQGVLRVSLAPTEKA